MSHTLSIKLMSIDLHAKWWIVFCSHYSAADLLICSLVPAYCRRDVNELRAFHGVFSQDFVTFRKAKNSKCTLSVTTRQQLCIITCFTFDREAVHVSYLAGYFKNFHRFVWNVLRREAVGQEYLFWFAFKNLSLHWNTEDVWIVSLFSHHVFVFLCRHESRCRQKKQKHNPHKFSWY